VDHSYLVNMLGMQLLLFGGWIQSSSSPTGWKKDDKATSSSMTLPQRLQRITPTFKPGGQVDYSYHSNSWDNAIMADSWSIHSVAELAQHLQDHIGLSVNDFDASARRALQAMLSWRIQVPSSTNESSSSSSLSPAQNPPTTTTIMLIFSLDATPSCQSLDNCPLAGPSNQLLAATAAQYSHDHPHVPIMAQWEVAVALQQSHGLSVIPVGEPGTFQNTAEIFQSMMQCACDDPRIHSENTNKNKNNHYRFLFVAHPDHLRRTLWTAQTMLWQQQQQQQQQLHNNNLKKNVDHACKAWSSQGKIIQLVPAMLPYSLDWPTTTSHRKSLAANMNLFQAVTTATVDSQGHQVETSWYDDKYLGFFSDAYPQLWTHRRDVWILYDQWAVAKGIVTGTINANLIDLPN
jgi:hypothetical protein